MSDQSTLFEAFGSFTGQKIKDSFRCSSEVVVLILYKPRQATCLQKARAEMRHRFSI
ncbi:hypothetical protein [Virgibacillus salarius]|uniref:hypothetical protein n=1 Tax=Virgibacillus salarius TaxID=447199 RepID=UPI003CD0DDB0